MIFHDFSLYTILRVLLGLLDFEVCGDVVKKVKTALTRKKVDSFEVDSTEIYFLVLVVPPPASRVLLQLG